jgi:hypothetical protein
MSSGGAAISTGFVVGTDACSSSSVHDDGHVVRARPRVDRGRRDLRAGVRVAQRPLVRELADAAFDGRHEDDMARRDLRRLEVHADRRGLQRKSAVASSFERSAETASGLPCRLPTEADTR